MKKKHIIIPAGQTFVVIGNRRDYPEDNPPPYALMLRDPYLVQWEQNGRTHTCWIPGNELQLARLS